MGTASSGTVLDLFISYAHADDDLRRELEKHLMPLVRDGVVKQWHDRLIGAGDDWREAIEKQLRTADIVLLLVSSDFMASDFCIEIELRRALQRHKNAEAVLIPVILRPVDWHSSVFGALQALPRDGK